MLKRTALRGLIFLSTLALTAGYASSAGLERKELSEEQVKHRVESLGVGITARVKVRLRNGVEMEGFIERAGESHFYLVRTDEELGTAAIVAYRDVTRIEGEKTSVTWRKAVYRVGAGFVLSTLRRLRILRPSYRADLAAAMKV